MIDWKKVLIDSRNITIGILFFVIYLTAFSFLVFFPPILVSITNDWYFLLIYITYPFILATAYQILSKLGLFKWLESHLT